MRVTADHLKPAVRRPLMPGYGRPRERPLGRGRAPCHGVGALEPRALEAERLFDGFELLDPGVVELPRWRPDAGTQVPADPVPIYGGVGRLASG
jgi:hypothetical protein